MNTPGPWEIKPSTIGCIKCNGRTVALALSSRDARLIAAAPELMAALKAFLTEDSQGFPASNMQVVWQARAAIAKAEESGDESLLNK